MRWHFLMPFQNGITDYPQVSALLNAGDSSGE